MSERPTAFHDLRPDEFPFKIEFISIATGEVVHEETVSGPGALMVPPLAHRHGRIRVRLTSPDGSVTDTEYQ